MERTMSNAADAATPRPRPRIVLIHAVREAIDPVRAAFAADMPLADVHDLLDTSLSADLAADGGVLSAAMVERFRTLGRYAAATSAAGRRTDAILFTCSAFGPAIEAVQRDLEIPVLKPNEAAFRQALAAGHHIGLLVTFEPSLAPLQAELEAIAAAAGRTPRIATCVVAPAMAALRAGSTDEHDRLVATAARSLGDADVVVLGQFSTARAAPAVSAACGRPVVTTPRAAVAALRARLRTS
jgi:Asp/Glu/hydantoin racemase